MVNVDRPYIHRRHRASAFIRARASSVQSFDILSMQAATSWAFCCAPRMDDFRRWRACRACGSALGGLPAPVRYISHGNAGEHRDRSMCMPALLLHAYMLMLLFL